MPNIKRIEGYNRTHGYYVEIERRYKNQRVFCAGKLFSDTKHSGKDKSLIAAKKYQQKVLLLFPPFCFRKKTIFDIVVEWKRRTKKPFPAKVLLSLDKILKESGIRAARATQNETIKDWVVERIIT